MNSVSILFSWHKNFGRVIKRHSLLSFMKESSSLVRQTELERIFNSHRYQVKKGYRSFHPFTLFEVRAGERNMRARNL